MEEKALRMMKLMGYKEGLGLGKAGQGLTEAIDVKSNLGTRGLGLNIENLNYSNDSWDYSQDKVEINESVEWLMNKNVNLIDKSVINNWLKEGVPNNDVAINNGCFCDEEIQKNVFKGKDIFNELDNKELNRARTRANPFETIRSVFFMNRAALKMANIDAACNFMFTSIEEAENEPVYFADVCAGPGGFSEYILWRNQWRYKGFGLTLKNEHDFTISKSTCASAATFQALYGDDQTGDVCNPNNIVNFVEKIKHETNFGVNFMMSDGGFCVDGQENLQEILSKRIYLSQCLIALSILRPNGHFVTKMFDIFTTFSVGLLYLMYLCFEQVVIIKPNSSRPANSERYFVCKNFQENAYTNIIREYLWKIVLRLWEIRCLPDKDILEIVPCEILQQDLNFYQYIVNTNNSKY